MNIEFEFPINNKNSKGKIINYNKAKISLPDYLLQHLLTNRQNNEEEINQMKNNNFNNNNNNINFNNNNINKKNYNSYSNISTKNLIKNYNLPIKRFLSPLNKYNDEFIKLRNENKKLKNENERLKKIILNFQQEKNYSTLDEKKNNYDNHLTNLILTMSYEKQNDFEDNFILNRNSNLNLIDDIKIKNIKNNFKKFNKQKNILDNLLKRTKKLLQNYNNILINNNNNNINYNNNNNNIIK